MDTGTAEVAAIEIQKSESVRGECPADALLITWAEAGVKSGAQADVGSGMTIRIVDSAEMQQCNLQWRGKDKPTNVLSFPADFPPEAGVNYLGDILICAEILKQESKTQNKALHDHWAHIVVHGVLHLQGFDHENEHDARQMEQREKDILTTLGVADPYRNDA